MQMKAYIVLGLRDDGDKEIVAVRLRRSDADAIAATDSRRWVELWLGVKGEELTAGDKKVVCGAR